MMGTTGNVGVVERLTRSTAEMSSHDRSEQADAMRGKLVELAAAHNRLVAVVDAQSKQVTALTDATDSQLSREKEYNALTGDLASRVGGIELTELCLSDSFWARLRWLFTGIK
jgi:hypothetical protein